MTACFKIIIDELAQRCPSDISSLAPHLRQCYHNQGTTRFDLLRDALERNEQDYQRDLKEIEEERRTNEFKIWEQHEKILKAEQDVIYWKCVVEKYKEVDANKAVQGEKMLREAVEKCKGVTRKYWAETHADKIARWYWSME